jgi:Pyruvate/2-oxoacid:ferredoxin oxidoreductase delta subunit
MKVIKKVIQIDKKKCVGCGQCAGACAQGAIQMVEGKAELVHENYCDGMGICIGQCPVDAISFIDKEIEAYDNQKYHNINLIEKKPIGHTCPSSMLKSFEKDLSVNTGKVNSQINNWPVQIKLMPVNAPYLNNADLLIAADCTSFAFGDFHNKLLKGKILMIGCPKLDDAGYYAEKLEQIFSLNKINSIEVAYMEVPCCNGIVNAVKTALKNSKKDISLKLTRISIDGKLI